MSSHTRQIENIQTLCQACDCFVSGVVEMQVFYIDPFCGDTKHDISPIGVDLEGALIGFGFVASDGFKNFQRPSGQRNIASVIVLCLWQVDHVAADVQVGNSANLARPHGRFDGKQEHRTSDLFFTNPRIDAQIKRHCQFVNFILVNTPGAPLGSLGAFNLGHRVDAQKAPFLRGRRKDVFEQVHFPRDAGGLHSARAHVTPCDQIGGGHLANDVFAQRLAVDQVVGKPLEPDHFPPFALLTLGPFEAITVKDLLHCVATGGAAGNANLKFTGPHLRFPFDLERLGLADGLSVYTPRNLRLPTVGRFENRRHAQNSNRIVATLAKDGSRTSHALPKQDQNKIKGKTMNERVTSLVSGGAPTRTLLSFNNNGLNGSNSNKIVNDKRATALPKPRKRSLLSQKLTPAHKGMSRALGMCLHLANQGEWLKFSKSALLRLTRAERKSLAKAALLSLGVSSREEVAAEAMSAAGGPLPTFLGEMDDARFWASMATNTELKAYALAAYEALPVAEQNAFRWHVGSVEVAV